MVNRRWLSLLLVLSLLLTGCGSVQLLKETLNEGADPFSQLMDAMYRLEPLVPFPEMPYEHPDEGALQGLFDTAATLAEESSDAEELMTALDDAFAAYDKLYTHRTIAMIRADSDVTDEYWQEEYAFCDRLSAQAEQWMEQMLRACALSKLRPRLEREGYFSPHELNAYEESNSYNDEIVALYQQESELVNAYRTLCADPDVVIDGETVKLNDYLANEDLDEDTYNEVYLAYLGQINEEAAELYCELVLLRRQIAEESGYEDYESFQYDYYGRDYTPEDAQNYLTGIKEVLGPYRQELAAQGEYEAITYPPMTEGRLMSTLEKTMEQLDPIASEAFSFMKEYELYNISADLKKAPTAYTAYLYSYNVPYVFVNTYNDVEDALFVAHEFGHFLAAYENDMINVALDLEETYSQGMEYLVLQELESTLSDAQYQALCRIKLLDTLDTYTGQGAYAAFEQAVYALPEDEINPQTLNELSRTLMAEYGYAGDGDEFNSLHWTQVSHLYEMPFYMLSYCVSVDSAMQIYALALEDAGEGWDAYCELLYRPGYYFLDALDVSGLENPMTDGRADAVMALLEEQLPK